MKKSLLFILGFILISITSCEYKFIDPLEITLPAGPVIFSTQIEPVFQDKCVTCHASTNPILTTGNAYNSLINGNYINTTDPESSALYQKVSEGHPGGNSLSAVELAVILKWITDGAENN
ncbi:hypothetical protein ACFLSE_03615 [Bacteroidota bacterium]